MRLLFVIFFISLISIAFAETTFAANCNTEQPQNKKRYTTNQVNIRTCGATYCKRLVTLPKGQIVFAYGQDGKWSTVNVKALNLTGYIFSKYLSEACVEGEEITRKTMSKSGVRNLLIRRSQSRYSGSCPCPDNYDRGGRRCGGRSAYLRDGGASPLCYTRDVSNSMIDSYRVDRKY